jgi:hypothetical protein
MIDCFKKDYWYKYKYTGNKIPKQLENWNISVVTPKKWAQCVDIFKNKSHYFIKFKNNTKFYYCTKNYLKYFIESKYNPKEKIIGGIMITKFKKDYWYKFVGNKNFFYSNEMLEILNGRWHKCIEVNTKWKDWIIFEGFEGEMYLGIEKNDFQESKCHPIKKLLEEIQ